MSSQKGNISRSRAQRYQNHSAFKNDLHDTSHKTKLINSIEVVNVCQRCKKIIEWKIKYKKYKPLKAPAKCTKCEQRTVKQAYHIMCLACAKQHKVCPKCGGLREIVENKPSREEQIKLDAELQSLLKTLPERKRRTFLRYVNQKGKNKDTKDTSKLDTNEVDDKDTSEDTVCSKNKEDLLVKLKSLTIVKGNDDDFDSDTCEDNSDDLDDSFM